MFVGASCDTSTDDPSGAGSGSTGDPLVDAGDAGDDDAEIDPCAPVSVAAPPADTCGAYARFPCGLPSSVVLGVGPGCYLSPNDCQKYCFAIPFNCHAVDTMCDDAGLIVPDDAGVVDIDCITCPGAIGRVPAGIAPARLARTTVLGDYFAKMAHLEAASVIAFERLADELAHHRAPARLVRAARRAASDERAHARAATRMARRFGAAPPAVDVQSIAPRPLREVAIENAVEGCVRETFGALVATHQARVARDPRIAAMMKRISRDETRHAALSLGVSRWALRRLDDATRQEIADQSVLMAASLGRCDATESAVRASADADALGLPDAEATARMLQVLASSLWV